MEFSEQRAPSKTSKLSRGAKTELSPINVLRGRSAKARRSPIMSDDSGMLYWCMEASAACRALESSACRYSALLPGTPVLPISKSIRRHISLDVIMLSPMSGGVPRFRELLRCCSRARKIGCCSHEEVASRPPGARISWSKRRAQRQ